MTEQRKHLLKMIGIMFYIMILPVLFFSYIGDNPNRVTEQMTREVAIVNEDTGAEQEGLSLKFGQEVSSLINQNSNYTWTVVGRSAAESGLENGDYDAILYVPSDFSEQVLKFRDRSPTKASIEFALQPQLNAKNSERVQRELEKARNQVNNEMSTIYWSYIAQEIDHVKESFTEILDKEIAFQEAINSFYSSGSQTLAEDISSQRELLSQLKTTIEEGNDGSENRIQTIEEADQFLAGFLDDVDAYRDYQQQQQSLLSETQSESQRMIEESSAVLAENQTQALRTFGERQENVLSDISGIQEQINSTTLLAGELNDQREGVLGQQFDELLALQSSVLEVYKQDLYSLSLNEIQQVLIPLRNAVVNDSAPPEEPPVEDPDPGEGIEIPEQSQLEDLSGEIAALEELQGNSVAQVDAVEGLLSGTPVELLPGLEDILAGLGGIRESLNSLEGIRGGLTEKQESYSALEANYNELIALLNDIEVPEVPEEEEEPEDTSIKDALRAIEAEILASPVLSESRKSVLSETFNQALNETNGTNLIAYAEVLGQYGQIVNELEKSEDPVAAELLGNEDLLATYQSILAVDEGEQRAWDALSGSMMQAEENVSDFSAQTGDLVARYNDIITEQQGFILEELDTITSSAQNLSTTLSEVNANESSFVNGESSSIVNGSQALTYQQQIGSELSSLNGLMDSLSERQEGVISYTSELQTEVDRVQEKSNTLNQNWEENILFTENVAADLNEIFDNASVDGQDNGYIYDFLSNPVDISGEVLEEETVNLPPVVMLVILLASALLIGFFTQHFSLSPWFVQLSLFGLLNLVVGLMISIYGLTIYPLANDQAIMWSVYTVLLLTAASGLVFVAFGLSTTIGWIVTVLLVLLFVAPLLDLILPNFRFEDPITSVYLSIQYGAQSKFPIAVMILSGIILMLALIPFLKNRFKTKGTAENEAA